MTHLVGDLHAAAVHRAEQQCAVQAELHVAYTEQTPSTLPRPTRLLPDSADVLTDVGGRDDHLRDRHVVVRDEHDLQLPLDARIAVDHLAHLHDQVNDRLCHAVGWGCLSSEDFHHFHLLSQLFFGHGFQQDVLPDATTMELTIEAN